MNKKMINIMFCLPILLMLFGCNKQNSIPTMDDVMHIQACSDATIYGTAVTKILITYKESTDLTNINKNSYVIEDRGSLNPDYGELEIDSVEVNENVVTINIKHCFDATDNNVLIYTGDNAEGVRERNSYGVYVTTGWYRDIDGNIHYGDGTNKEYLSNENNFAYQKRACLDLRLKHKGEDNFESLSDELGKYNKNSKWLETIDLQFGEDGFKNLYDLKIVSTASNVKDKTGDKYVRGYYYVPSNYNPDNGIVFVLQGQGICYWRLEDGSDNEGTGIMFDTATTSWKNTGAIVVNIHDRSSYAKDQGTFWDTYDFVLDDVNVMKYFIEKYNVTGNIVLQGNSRGTMASSMIIKALAGQTYNPKNQIKDGDYNEDQYLDKDLYNFTVDCFICQNGSFGYQYDEDDWKAISDTNLKVWAFNGEQDTNDIPNISKYSEMMINKNGEDWAKENIRLTALPSELFYPFGESDHSVTRINGWFFGDVGYYGPDLKIDENGDIAYSNKLSDGDTYTLLARGNGSTKKDYKYIVYDKSFHLWACEPLRN